MPAEIIDAASGSMIIDALNLRLAQQVAPRSWRASLERVATALDAGRPLEQAIGELSGAAPRELKCLLESALAAPDPASLIVEAIQIRSEIRRSWSELRRLILYPAALFVFAVTIGVGFSYCMQLMIDLTWLEDFGLAGTETILASFQDQHHSIVGLGLVTLWGGLILLTIAIAGPPWAWMAVLGGVVVIGKPLRWVALQEVLERYRLFVAQGLSTDQAAAAVTASFQGSGQAVVARVLERRIEAGVPLGQALGVSMLADGLCRPSLLLLDQRGSEMTRALGETARMLRELSAERCRSLGSILPVFVLATVGSIIWAALSTYVMALQPLIQAISSLA